MAEWLPTGGRQEHTKRQNSQKKYLVSTKARQNVETPVTGVHCTINPAEIISAELDRREARVEPVHAQ